MTAARGSYDISLVSHTDSRWARDSSQKHCYVCTTARLSKGKRHHCRLCGNISCNECCPRICKKCLAENVPSISMRKSLSNSRLSTLEDSFSSYQYETISRIQRLCKLKSKQIMWKAVEMIDKTYYEAVYIVNEVSCSTYIIRTVDGKYYAANKDILFAAPQKENILDSLQSLLHGYMNRSRECCISLTKPLYALQENDALLENYEINGNENRILKQCNILSFFPMLQKECYKLNGFIFKSSLTKMNIDNVQLFHFVSDHDSPKQIPAYFNEDKTNDNNNKKRRHAHSPSLGSIDSKSIELSFELSSFKKGYQEMRKMYEDYVSANEMKLKQANERLETLQKEKEELQKELNKYKDKENTNSRDVIGSEYHELFTVHHCQLFDLLFVFCKSYCVSWNEEYLNRLIYELLFCILIACYDCISKYEYNVSLTLCKELSINKDTLYKSINCNVLYESTDKINDIKHYVIQNIFIKEFILKYLKLNSHQISKEIHLKLSVFISKCIHISWKMCTHYPLLRFTPNTFNTNGDKYDDNLHNIHYDTRKSQDRLLYYIWPIISHNNTHSIVHSMRIEVCLGDVNNDEDEVILDDDDCQ